jgi:Prp8 binding protein
MSVEKRPAADSFESNQIVKRQKSKGRLDDNRSIAIVNGAAQNGALIQAVCQSQSQLKQQNEGSL